MNLLIADKVKINVNGQSVSAEGPAGKHSLTLHAEISAKIEEGKRVVVSAKGTSQIQKALWGTWRSHVANLLEGVSKGFEKTSRSAASATTRSSRATSSR